MPEPCVQGERLVSLETILEQMSETLHEQKQLGVKTYEVLACISKQGEQINSLTARQDKSERDTEELFGRVRKSENTVIEHSGFIASHIAAEDKQSRITAPVFSGLLIAVIVAIVTFGIVMIDRHNYAAPQAEVGK